LEKQSGFSDFSRYKFNFCHKQPSPSGYGRHKNKKLGEVKSEGSRYADA
jgi:hypothetical protein